MNIKLQVKRLYKSEGKFLDVTLNNKLKFNLHVKIISKSIAILYKLKDYLSKSSLRSLYYYTDPFTIIPFLYCNLAWTWLLNGQSPFNFILDPLSPVC